TVTPPTTPTEQQITDIFTTILTTTNPISTDDNFFDLGGNSLQVIRVVNRLNNAFGTTLGVRDFYTAPNIATLANRIDALAAPDGQDEETLRWQLLNEVEQMSDEEVERLLAAELAGAEQASEPDLATGSGPSAPGGPVAGPSDVRGPVDSPVAGPSREQGAEADLQEGTIQHG
ncbi:acyl carrier protein, partial [Plantactinospora sp. B5E13]|uniref:acyl carrier protein n=1 Tax=unclassified Plantactinospora TaxID=2631981 RepID=UPI00325E849A